MKTLITIFLMLSVMLVACKKKTEEPSTEDLLTDHPWNLQSTTVDQVTVDYYDGLTLTFNTNGSYTTTNGGSLWQSTGSWSWLDDAKTTILRNDGLELHIQSISATQLVLTFVWDNTVYESGGRTESVQGDHRMVFTD